MYISYIIEMLVRGAVSQIRVFSARALAACQVCVVELLFLHVGNSQLMPCLFHVLAGGRVPRCSVALGRSSHHAQRQKRKEGEGKGKGEG